MTSLLEAIVDEAPLETIKDLVESYKLEPNLTPIIAAISHERMDILIYFEQKGFNLRMRNDYALDFCLRSKQNEYAEFFMRQEIKAIEGLELDLDLDLEAENVI
jgi:hypothetical protein